jgi:hypothetical protein
MPILSSVPSRTTRSSDLQRSVEPLEFPPPWRSGIVRLHPERESMCSLLHSDNSYGTFRWLGMLARLLGREAKALRKIRYRNESASLPIARSRFTSARRRAYPSGGQLALCCGRTRALAGVDWRKTWIHLLTTNNSVAARTFVATNSAGPQRPVGRGIPALRNRQIGRANVRKYSQI